MWNKTNNLTSALLTLALSLPAPALACTVCYGGSEGPQAEGNMFGVLTLALVAYFVLGGIALFFIHLARKASKSTLL